MSVDLRHDSFLHSPARAWRRFKWLQDHPGEAPPKEWIQWPAMKPQAIKHVSRPRHADSYRGAGDHAKRMATRRQKQIGHRPTFDAVVRGKLPHQGKRECVRRAERA